MCILNNNIGIKENYVIFIIIFPFLRLLVTVISHYTVVGNVEEFKHGFGLINERQIILTQN